MKILFTALVHPHLQFGNVVWVPHIQTDRLLIRGVQRHATKLVPVLKELDYRKRPKSMDLPSKKIDIETVTRGYKYKLKKKA